VHEVEDSIHEFNEEVFLPVQKLEEEFKSAFLVECRIAIAQNLDRLRLVINKGEADTYLSRELFEECWYGIEAAFSEAKPLTVAVYTAAYREIKAGGC